MLTLDLTGLSQTELERVVAEYCSPFGCATILKVLRPDDHSGHGAAAVKMSTMAEADDLARNVGGARCGSKVIIRLLQRGRRIPAISKKNYLFGSVAESAPSAALH